MSDTLAEVEYRGEIAEYSIRVVESPTDSQSLSRLLELDFTADANPISPDEIALPAPISEFWQRFNLCLLICVIVGITIAADYYAVTATLGG